MKTGLKKVPLEVALLLPDHTPTFVRENKVLIGLIVQDSQEKWICSLGGKYGATGPYDSRDSCLEALVDYNYEFYVRGRPV